MADVGVMKLNLVFNLAQVLFMAGEQIVDYANLAVAERKQVPHERGTDEPGAANYQVFLHAVSW
jgi:hypothetical protein